VYYRDVETHVVCLRAQDESMLIEFPPILRTLPEHCQQTYIYIYIYIYIYVYILYKVTGYSMTSDHQLYRVTPLKTPFGLVLLLFQSQSHVTTFTHNYFLRCATFTQLTITHVRNYNHLLHSYTFTLADFSAINYFLKLSQTLHLHTSKLSPRSYSANSPLKTPS
jgi:hypothetical protein